MLNQVLQAAEGNAADGAVYPQIINIAFQMAFAMITASIVTGSLAGRVKFGAMTAFLGIWLLVVYAPLAHMVWGGEGSFIGDIIGALDFAGGDVVHISSGLTGLILCLMLGRRRGFGMVSYRPHNVPFVALGAGLLWFGWFGFNGGSEFKADAVAALSILNTVTAGAAGMVSWLAVEHVHTGRPTLVGASTGLVAGLVVVTPGAGFVEPWAALVMGLIVSPVCYLAISHLKTKFGYDDALDAFGCHGIGGILGGVLTGLFCVPELSWTGKGGLFYTGDVSLLISQILGIVVTVAIVLVLDLVVAAVVKAVPRQPACGRGRRGAGLGCESARRERVSLLLGTRLAARLSQAPDLAPQTVACVPKYAALLFRSNLGHLENPCHVKDNSFLLLKRGIHYEEDYGDCSC